MCVDVCYVQIRNFATFNIKCSWDGLPGERNCFCVWSFCCSELCSVDQTVTAQRESVLNVRVQSDFARLFALSGRVQFLGEWGGGCTNDSLSSPDYLTESSEVRFGSWAEPDSYWCAEDWFNDGRAELFQQLLWQVELPQLVKEVQPLLGLFYNGLNVIVPLQILRNCGAKNLNDSTAVTVLFVMVRAGSFLLKSIIISTVLSVLISWLSRLHQTASSFTSCL